MRHEERVLLPTVLCAEHWYERMRGLLGHRSLPEGSGMLLSPCDSVHTLGMRFAIDVVYVDADQQVVRIVKHLPPFRMSFGGRRARSTLEIHSGWFDFSTLAIGMTVTFEAQE